MSTGPIIIYDKSTLQALNPAEATWLSHHYRANITPIFFVEVLADLSKPAPTNRDPEDVVRGIAAKISGMGSMPNVSHWNLCTSNLLGYPVEQRGVPIVGGGRRVKSADGKVGVFFDEPPETAAMRRWSAGDFLGVERDLASTWREALGELGLEKTAALLRSAGKSPLRTLEEVKTAADQIADGKGGRFKVLKLAFAMLGIQHEYWPAVLSRWKKLGGPPLSKFAPYADYVFRIDVFFYLALASGKIAATRPSNRVDIAYLYYLPFCNIFSSFDRLHATVAPLFMSNDQLFVHGADLKADLGALNVRYNGLAPEVKARGSMRYAAYPPLDGNFLTSRLFDHFLPGWRDHAQNSIEITPEMNRRIMEQLKPMLDAIETSSPKKGK